MRIKKRVNTKRVSDLVDGELFRAELASNAALCIKIGTDMGTHFVRYAILESEDIEHPVYFDGIDDIFPVLSYGLDWSIQMREDKRSFSKNSSLTRKPGVLLLKKDSVILCLGRHPSSSDGPSLGFFDLEAKQIIGSTSSEAVPIPHWLIWAAGEGPSDYSATPVFKFSA